MGSSVVRGHGSVVRQNGTWSASIQKSRAARSSLSPLQLRAFVSSSSPIPATRTCSDPALCRLGGFTQARTKHPVDVSRRLLIWHDGVGCSHGLRASFFF